MKFRGGYNILLKGKPKGEINLMPEPEVLYLPLYSRRFTFNEICVEEGQQVNGGDVLARDLDNYSVPLLAPRAGRVRLNAKEGYIVLEQVALLAERPGIDDENLPHIAKEMGTSGIKRYRLLTLGAWQFFYDAYSGQLPDPLGKPQAIIVSTLSLEPFLTRGDVQLHNRLLNFTRGLEQLQSLLEYQPIYLVLPDIRSEFANLIRNRIRGYAYVKMLEVPLTYPYDDFSLLARRLGLKRSGDPVWAVRTEGVLAVDRALTLSKPCLVRIVSIGGMGVNDSTHISTIPGYPVQKIREKYIFESVSRIINGGILTGEILGDDALGIDTECRGLTILPELKEREFFGFIRPGWDRSSYTPCYLSSLRAKFRECFNTGFHGEGRPCISCNFCEDVCPAGITPHLIHKYLYRDLIEEVEQARVDLCIECGLCSYVCPSKIDLRKQMIDSKVMIAREKEEIRREQERQEEFRKQEEARRKAKENSE
ncbi:MAG: 4Fe-4S dicluster domain-containing protein [Sedimentisphaerales bacterium]|nr:4Fe-4S dicluster domain-containing protein [Sedimentisphaerales bacterium]